MDRVDGPIELSHLAHHNVEPIGREFPALVAWYLPILG